MFRNTLVIKKCFFAKQSFVLGAGLILVVLSPIASASTDLLEQLVKINSHSHNLAGIQRIRDILIPEFEKLGFQCQTFDLKEGRKLVLFSFPNHRAKVVLLGHLDTVFPETEPGGKFRSEKDRVYGPGIIDMKGGIVVILEALRELSISQRSHIQVVLNDDEELASFYSKEKIKSLVKGVPYGLVFEPGAADGSVVTSASGGRWMKIQVQGKAAHAGLEHSKGVNACVELASKVPKLQELTNYDRKFTVNVGVLQGGTQPNVVCEEAHLVLDFRYVRKEDENLLIKKIHAISKENYLKNSSFPGLPKSNTETLAIVPSMPEASTKKLSLLAKKSAQELGYHLSGKHVGYATDANHLVESGMNLLVGLGPYGGGMHTNQEFLLKESISKRVALNVRLIQKILKQEKVE